MSQDNRPEGLNPGACKYGARVLFPRSVVCSMIFSPAQGVFSDNVNICEFTAFGVRHSSLYILNISSSISPRRLTGLVRQVQLLFRDGSVVGNIVWSR